MNTNVDAQVAKDTEDVLKKFVQKISIAQNVTEADDSIKEAIKFFRELKRQYETSVSVTQGPPISVNDKSIEGVSVTPEGPILVNKHVVLDAATTTLMKQTVCNLFAQQSVAYEHFLNFMHNLKHFNKISKYDWNDLIIINHRCEETGDFGELHR